ncbi:hypothetical protein F4774DRAFT_392035 [Daldinia eschscholtzii]|nr:hypothetical protein F4774DRAFT_392035 [Daldinia eschscholtzii]
MVFLVVVLISTIQIMLTTYQVANTNSLILVGDDDGGNSRSSRRRCYIPIASALILYFDIRYYMCFKFSSLASILHIYIHVSSIHTYM